MTKIIILILFFVSCNVKDNNEYKHVNLNKTQKVQVQGFWESEYTLSYLWSDIQGPKNHNSSKIIIGDQMLFTPGISGKYIITVSIQNSMGSILGEEKFYYKVTGNNKAKKKVADYTINENRQYSSNDDSLKSINNNNKEENQNDGYTIQITSWDNFEDAIENRNYLKNNGFNAYISESLVKGKEWYRVRVGQNLSYDKCLSLMQKLKKITNDKIWIDKF